MKVKELIIRLLDEPMNAEIMVWDLGDTGYVDGCELEIITYENLKPDININIKAESGFH